MYACIYSLSMRESAEHHCRCTVGNAVCIQVFWVSDFVERPEGRGGNISVGYFQNLAFLAGFSKVTYPRFNIKVCVCMYSDVFDKIIY